MILHCYLWVTKRAKVTGTPSFSRATRWFLFLDFLSTRHASKRLCYARKERPWKLELLLLARHDLNMLVLTSKNQYVSDQRAQRPVVLERIKIKLGID